MDDGEEDQVGVDDDVDVDGEEAVGKNETRSFAREDQLDAVLIEVALLCCVVVVRPCEPRPLRCGPSAPIGAPAADQPFPGETTPSPLPPRGHERPSLATIVGGTWRSERDVRAADGAKE